MFRPDTNTLEKEVLKNENAVDEAVLKRLRLPTPKFSASFRGSLANSSIDEFLDLNGKNETFRTSLARGGDSGLRSSRSSISSPLPGAHPDSSPLSTHLDRSHVSVSKFDPSPLRTCAVRAPLFLCCCLWQHGRCLWRHYTQKWLQMAEHCLSLCRTMALPLCRWQHDQHSYSSCIHI